MNFVQEFTRKVFALSCEKNLGTFTTCEKFLLPASQRSRAYTTDGFSRPSAANSVLLCYVRNSYANLRSPTWTYECVHANSMCVSEQIAFQLLFTVPDINYSMSPEREPSPWTLQMSSWSQESECSARTNIMEAKLHNSPPSGLKSGFGLPQHVLL